MKNNYKRLGDYIQKVDVRNTEDLDIPLMGLSIQKCFIPSIANTIGTDMRTYKVIERNHFAYGPVTSRNGEKITIALFEDFDKALISQAYIPFEIIDTEKLLPRYLMMWFSRPEFDRYARYKSHGSARETFDWEEMCEVELPIPNIEKQRQIVADYQAVENKIKTNEAICEKLEETAQTIYRRWFEEFEFPDEEGKPYKSNGGKMVWNEELEKDVPVGWEVKNLKALTTNTLGGDWGKESKEGNYVENVLCIRGTDIPLINNYDFRSTPERYILSKNLKNRQLKAGNITIEISGGSPSQSTGRITLINDFHLKVIDKPVICSNFCRIIEVKKDFHQLYKFELNNNYDSGLFFTYENGTHGVKNLDLNALLEDLKICYNYKSTIAFNEIINLIDNKIFLIGIENQKLQQLRELLLARMTRGKEQSF